MKFNFLKLSPRNTHTRQKFLLGAILAERYGKELRAEYRFYPTRRFRADWYIPKLNVLIEYEGIFGGKARHTSVCGYSTDCEKYNLATVMGFRILRYTAKNYTQAITDLEELEQDLKVGGSI